MSPIKLQNATRHSKATQLLNSGVDMATVARLLTHSGTAHTRRYAVHEMSTLKSSLAKIKPLPGLEKDPKE